MTRTGGAGRWQGFSAGTKNTTYLRKWLVLGSLIGVVAGVGAILFTEALDAANHLLLGTLGGYHTPLPVGEGNVASSSHVPGPWAVPIVVGAGGLLSGILVNRLAPEAAGHGTDAAIDAVHHNPTGIRPRVSVVKIVSSAITIGSGGSGGREGPTAQISSSFASFLARKLDLTPADARIALTVGMGAGIGAIFRAHRVGLLRADRPGVRPARDALLPRLLQGPPLRRAVAVERGVEACDRRPHGGPGGARAAPGVGYRATGGCRRR